MVDLDPRKTTLILGPPGTGKTTTLLTIVREALESGVDPAHIAFVSFTVRAAKEARSRACTQLGVSEKQLKYFRTLHSMAGAGIVSRGGEKNLLLTAADFDEISVTTGINCRGGKYLRFPGFVTDGDQALQSWDFARHSEIRFSDQWALPQNEPGIPLAKASYFIDQYEKYKHDNKRIDFTDLIMAWIDRGTVPEHFRLLLVDEAQDLTKLEWRMVEKLARASDRIYIAGDDDQALFTWCGADIESFLTLPGDRRVLGQSYRVPRSIHAVANRIAGQINHRIPKKWAPRDEVGEIVHLNSIDEIDFGSELWLVLARTRFKLEGFAKRCVARGVTCSMYDETVEVTPGLVDSVAAWSALGQGVPIGVGALQTMLSEFWSSKQLPLTSAKRMKVIDELDPRESVWPDEIRPLLGIDHDKPWWWMFTKITSKERQYVRRLWEQGKRPSDTQVRLSSIHGVKGAQADNVVLNCDLTGHSAKQVDQDLDNELRVLYVATTRARKRLFLLQGRGRYQYRI